MVDHATVYAPLYLFPRADQLAALAPDAEIDWAEQQATLELGQVRLRLTRMPDEQMADHLQGFQGYVRQRGGSEGLAIRVLSTLSVYGLVIEPGFDEAGAALGLVARLTAATDGLCFLEGEVRDAAGRGLLLAGEHETPSPERVAARCLVLLALAVRGLLEDDAGGENAARAEDQRQRLNTWISDQDALADEAEPHEREILATPIGQADGQAIIDSVWRAEGAAVLLWALDARELPAHDEQDHPYEVAAQLGVGKQDTSPLLAAPQLKSAAELDWMRRRLLAIYWRVVHHRLGGEPVDFREFADTAWFGGFDPVGVALCDGDLCIGGQAITDADADRVKLASSTALERYHAMNWLVGAHPVYSRVATPT